MKSAKELLLRAEQVFAFCMGSKSNQEKKCRFFNDCQKKHQLFSCIPIGGWDGCFGDYCLFLTDGKEASANPNHTKPPIPIKASHCQIQVSKPNRQRTRLSNRTQLAVGQHQWYHFGVGAPLILEPILLVGTYFSGWIGMFTGGTI